MPTNLSWILLEGWSQSDPSPFAYNSSNLPVCPILRNLSPFSLFSSFFLERLFQTASMIPIFTMGTFEFHNGDI